MQDERVNDPNGEEKAETDFLSTMTQWVFTLVLQVGRVVRQGRQSSTLLISSYSMFQESARKLDK